MRILDKGSKEKSMLPITTWDRTDSITLQASEETYSRSQRDKKTDGQEDNKKHQNSPSLSLQRVWYAEL